MKAQELDGEELAVRILGDNNIGGFTPLKALKCGLAQSVMFDESLIYCEDVHWLINILAHHKDIRACRINYYLYCYVQHKNKGITRDSRISYTSNGFPLIIEAYMKQYAFGCYFRSRLSTIMKLKTFIKRILSLLHIYKHKKSTPL